MSPRVIYGTMNSHRRGLRRGPIVLTVTGPSIPGHELAGVVTVLGYGTTGLSVGQRVFELTDWYRDGTLAEYVAVEARNLAPLPVDVDFKVGATLVMSALTAWQGLFDHGPFGRVTTLEWSSILKAIFVLGSLGSALGLHISSMARLGLMV